MGRKHWLRDGHEHVFLQSRQCGWICVTFSAFCSHWALRFPAWLLQDLLNNKYMCSHICFNHHSQMFLLRQTFPLCCLLKRRKFWHVWCSCIGSVCVCVCAQVAQSCPTLCEPLDVACQALLFMEFPRPERIPEWVAVPFPGIFLTQGWNPGLPHWRWIWATREASR